MYNSEVVSSSIILCQYQLRNINHSRDQSTFRIFKRRQINYIFTEESVLFVLDRINLIGNFVNKSWRIDFIFARQPRRNRHFKGDGFYETFRFSHGELYEAIPFGIIGSENNYNNDN